jgi:hypothetical protein
MEQKTAGRYDRNVRPLGAEKKLKVEKSPLVSFLSLLFKNSNGTRTVQPIAQGKSCF